MSELRMEPQPMIRITCMTHQLLEPAVTECLLELGVHDVLLENGRCVRQRARARSFWLPGQRLELDDSPTDIFQMTVPADAARQVATALIDAADLRTPGRGMLYLQEVVAYGYPAASGVLSGPASSSGPSGLLPDMVLLTCILSMAGSGEPLARVVLTFGVGVPVVSRGVGSGLRDRLGLLRIAIPAEKEIVRFMIPAHDADGVRRLLIEEARIDRAGGGFLYQTPIREGIADPLMRLGPQQYAASMEQMITALDDLKGGTRWRTRYAGLKNRDEEVNQQTLHGYCEVAFSCSEGNAETLVREAMEAGAGGATTSTANCLRSGKPETRGSLRETGILCVPAHVCDAVLAALAGAAAGQDDEACRIQVLEAPAAFTYQQRASQ